MPKPERRARAFAELDGETLPHRRAVRLGFTPPLDWRVMLAYLSPRAIPGVEVVSADAYARTLSFGTARGVLRATWANGEISVELASDARIELARVTPALRRMFDLDAVPAEICTRFADDSLIGPLVAARPGIRVPGAWDPFEFSVRVMLGQQVSVAGATTLTGRLVTRHGVEVFSGDGVPGLTHAFPAPATLARADVAGIGIPRSRARSISAFAAEVAGDWSILNPQPDLGTALARLVALPGIGPWTANYIAMRALGQRDAFPESDLGLLRAASRPGEGRLKPAELLRIAERWRPLRSYAAMQLWLSE